MSVQQQQSGNRNIALRILDRATFKRTREARANQKRQEELAKARDLATAQAEGQQKVLGTATAPVLLGTATPSEEFYSLFINEVLPEALRGAPDTESSFKKVLCNKDFADQIRSSAVLTPFEEAADPNGNYRKEMRARRDNLANSLESGIVTALSIDELDILLTTILSKSGPSKNFFEFLELSAKAEKPQEYGLAIAEVLKKLSTSVTSGNKTGDYVRNRFLVDRSVLQSYVDEKTTEVTGQVAQFRAEVESVLGADPEAGPINGEVPPGLGKKNAAKLADDVAVTFGKALYAPHNSVDALGQIPEKEYFTSPEYTNKTLESLLDSLAKLQQDWNGYENHRKAKKEYESAKRESAEAKQRFDDAEKISTDLSAARTELDQANAVLISSKELPVHIENISGQLETVTQAEFMASQALSGTTAELAKTSEAIQANGNFITKYEEGMTAKRKFTAEVVVASREAEAAKHLYETILSQKPELESKVSLLQQFIDVSSDSTKKPKTKETELSSIRTELQKKGINPKDESDAREVQLNLSTELAKLTGEKITAAAQAKDSTATNLSEKRAKLAQAEVQLGAIDIAALQAEKTRLEKSQTQLRAQLTESGAEVSQLRARKLELQTALDDARANLPSSDEVERAQMAADTYKVTVSSFEQKYAMAQIHFQRDHDTLSRTGEIIRRTDVTKLNSDEAQQLLLLGRITQFVSTQVDQAHLPQTAKEPIKKVCTLMQSGSDISNAMEAVNAMASNYKKPVQVLARRAINRLGPEKKQTILFLSSWRHSEKPEERQKEPSSWLGRRLDDYVNLQLLRPIPPQHSKWAYGMIVIPTLWYYPARWIAMGAVALARAEKWFFSNLFRKHHVTEDDMSKGKSGIPAIAYKIPAFLLIHGALALSAYETVDRYVQIRTNLSDYAQVSRSGAPIITGSRPQHEHASVFKPGEHGWVWGAHWYSLPPFYQLGKAYQYAFPNCEVRTYFTSIDGVEKSHLDGRRMRELPALGTHYYNQFIPTYEINNLLGVKDPTNVQWLRDRSMQPIDQHNPVDTTPGNEKKDQRVLYALTTRAIGWVESRIVEGEGNNKVYGYAMPIGEAKAKQLTDGKKGDYYKPAGHDENNVYHAAQFIPVRMDKAPLSHHPDYLLDPVRGDEFVRHLKTTEGKPGYPQTWTYEELNKPGYVSEFIRAGYFIQKEQKFWRDTLVASNVRNTELYQFLAANASVARKLLIPHLDAEKSPVKLNPEAVGEFVGAWKSAVVGGKESAAAFDETLSEFTKSGKTTDTTHEYQLARVRGVYTKLHGAPIATEHPQAYAVVSNRENPDILQLVFETVDKMDPLSGRIMIPDKDGSKSYGVEIGDLIMAAQAWKQTGTASEKHNASDYSPVPKEGRVGSMVKSAIIEGIFTPDVEVPTESSTATVAQKSAEEIIKSFGLKTLTITGSGRRGSATQVFSDASMIESSIDAWVLKITTDLSKLPAYKSKKPEELKAAVAEKLKSYVKDGSLTLNDMTTVGVRNALVHSAETK